MVDGLELLSVDPLGYGATAAHYTGLMAAIALCGLIAIWTLRRDDIHLGASARMTNACKKRSNRRLFGRWGRITHGLGTFGNCEM